MNIYYAARRDSINRTAENPEPFVLLERNSMSFLVIVKTAETPAELARRYHSLLGVLRERQSAPINNHFTAFSPPEDIGVIAANRKKEDRTDYYTLERLTTTERKEFEMTLMHL